MLKLADNKQEVIDSFLESGADSLTLLGRLKHLVGADWVSHLDEDQGWKPADLLTSLGQVLGWGTRLNAAGAQAG